jgi:hypothetical protein
MHLLCDAKGRSSGYQGPLELCPFMSAVEAGLRPRPVQRGGVAVLVTSREEEPQINVTMANVLIPFLVGGTLAASYLSEYLHVPPVAANVFYAGAVACIIGGIGFTILSVIKSKQKVAARYSLVCQACGHRPKTSQILLTAQIGRCAACGKELNLHKP